MDLKNISFLLALLMTFKLSRGEGIDERVKKEINKWSAKTYRSQTDFFKILGNQVEEVSCESDGDCREGKKCVSAKWQEGKKSCRCCMDKWILNDILPFLQGNMSFPLTYYLYPLTNMFAGGS